MSAAEHLTQAIDVGCTRDDHDHIAMHRAEVLAEAADFLTEIGTPITGERSEHERGLMYGAERLRLLADPSKAARMTEATDALNALPPKHDVPAGEVRFTGHPATPLSGWHYTELAPDYYGHVFMQIGGWLPEGWPIEDTPAGTARMDYAHLHGRAVPRGMNVQVSTKGYGGPRRFIKIQWRKDGAA
ncbi:hypothetical protein ACFV1G_21305 [Streptomyces anulatus]|uniref:hypothetical protein n=1 Tax=Streptomyces anulatus TaxID=1892 RepID=UPI0036BBFE5C